MQSKLVFNLNSTGLPGLQEIGGKAKFLNDLSNSGFPVPDGFVLSVNFFMPWMKKIKSSEEWNQNLSKITPETCRSIQKKAESFQFTSVQQDDIKKFVDNLKTISGYAVRSSSPEEDLADMSFAGMYETYLGVSANKLESTIAKVFASAFSFRVMEYKNQNRIPIEDTKIAVLVQTQIASEVSGVGFSLNPNNNCYDEAVINASFGLGEPIVSGLVTPDKYVVDKNELRIIEKVIINKDITQWIHEDGGIIEKKLENASKQTLSDKQTLEITKLIIKCEKQYKIPVDIEWAIENGVLYLLQVRPITAYIPLFPELLTKPGEKKRLYVDHIAITQGFSEQLSVLGGDIWGEIVYRAEAKMFPIEEGGFMQNLHGKQLFNVSNILRGMGVRYTKLLLSEYNKTIMRSLESVNLKREYRAIKRTKAMRKAFVNTIKGSSFLIRSTLTSRRNSKKLVSICLEINKSVLSYINEDLRNNSGFDILVDESANQLARFIAHQGALVGAMYALNRLNKKFKKYNLENEILSLAIGLKHNPNNEMIRNLFELASHQEIQHTSSGEEFKAKIEQKKYSPDFLEKYYAYMIQYGNRIFKEIDIATPRMYENLEGFYIQLKSMNLESIKVIDVEEKRKIAYEKLLKVAKGGGFEKTFIKEAAIYQDLYGFRETPKHIYAIYMGKIRKIALEIGKNFVREGRLDNSNQIFNLHVKDIARAQIEPNFDLKECVRRNIAPYELVKHVKHWPNVIDSRGKIFRVIQQAGEEDLIGDPISPGIITGKAKVLNSPYEKKMEPGEILVTKATEPSWTPVFINAAGAVLEVGGTLQHGATIAREYGLPCVSGIIDATSIIKDGDLLEVDGTSGIVKIIR